MRKLWQRRIPTLVLFLLLVPGAACCSFGTTMPAPGEFQPADFEPDEEQSAVAIHLSKDTFLPGETILYTIDNRSPKTVYYPTLGSICDWPATVLYTFYPEAPDSEATGWERVTVEALNFTVIEEGPYLGQLAAGETVVCSWDQSGWQAVELEGANRFTKKEPASRRALLPVPSGRYQFGFIYSDYPDLVLSARVILVSADFLTRLPLISYSFHT